LKDFETEEIAEGAEAEREVDEEGELEREVVAYTFKVEDYWDKTMGEVEWVERVESEAGEVPKLRERFI
jgi:hypothetical protein